MPDSDDTPDYLDAEQIRELGYDPDVLQKLGIRPLTGNDGRECWTGQQVREWLENGEQR